MEIFNYDKNKYAKQNTYFTMNENLLWIYIFSFRIQKYQKSDLDRYKKQIRGLQASTLMVRLHFGKKEQKAKLEK